MPVRATKRGDARTPLSGDFDVLVCGASFAGLTIARELAGSGANVLMVDRYEIGERQTSACAAPTAWLDAMGVGHTAQQTFRDLVVHSSTQTFRWPLPFTFSTFDYRTLCLALAEQGDAAFETAAVQGRTATARGHVVHTDRGDLRAPLVVDALGWRRVLGPDANVQPPDARLSRGLEVHPHAHSEDLELWLDPAYVPAGYAWSFPADGELRVGIGSFEPRFHVREPTARLAADVGVPAERWQGNWIPHELRAATEDGVFFVGDSAGHCLPTTAEGIRPAFYFGLALGRELRDVLGGRQTREQALRRYGAFSDEHAWKYRWMLRTQSIVSRVNPRQRVLDAALRAFDQPAFTAWAFGHYARICPPAFAHEIATQRPPVADAAAPALAA